MYRPGIDKPRGFALADQARYWRWLSDWFWRATVVGLLGICGYESRLRAQDFPTRDQLQTLCGKVFGTPPAATSLSPKGRIWVEPKRKLVIVDGYVTLTQGQLEMFACPVGTKEHESVVAVFATAQQVHAGLLAIGAKSGRPTQFEPYRPASGSTIKIQVLWYDQQQQKQQCLAQHWIRDFQSGGEMPFDWVFAGSILQKDADTGEEYYLGDSGDLICVANFPTATLDIAVESISSNSGLTFGAYTEHLPPLFTVCRLVLEVSPDPPRQERAKGKASAAKDGLPVETRDAPAVPTPSAIPSDSIPEAKSKATRSQSAGPEADGARAGGDPGVAPIDPGRKNP
jgi:hypothetical protein